MASKLDTITQKVVSNVDGALGCAVVDLETGLVMGAHHSVPYFTQTYIEAVASAAVNMFRGRGITNIEDLLTKQRGEKVENSIQEVQMTTKGTFHFMTVVPDKPNALVVLITDRKANLGAGWSAVRGALKEIAPECP